MNEPAPWLRQLDGRRVLARLAILFERLWPALWPPLAVAGLFVCAALLNLPSLLPSWLHLVLLIVTGLAIVVLLARGLRRIRIPDDDAADRRLELASGLRHRPLSVLTDQPARVDPAGMALWHAHVRRAAAQIHRLHVGLPRPGLARLDRRALRGGLVVALVAAFVIAGQDAPSRLAAAMEPGLPMAEAAPATEVQVWITPPAYTKLPPLFLKPEGGAVQVPSGAHLTASLTGGTDAPALSLNGVSEPFRALDQASFQADRVLTQGGRLAIRRDGRELAAWELTVVADQPPTVSWAEPPGRAGNSQQTRLPWKAADDYGVASLQAEIHLQARPAASPVVVAIPLPGGAPKQAHGVSQHDLTAQPWAGLPVTARLVARDGAGQTGTSETAEFNLPERLFSNPIARKLIELRKGLSLHPDDRTEALAGLDSLLQEPEAFGSDSGAFVNLSALYYLLVRNKDPGAVPQAQGRMWELALHLEEGQTEQTARALEQARQAARDALDKATQDPTDANRQALEQRLRELEQAIERHMQALLEEAQRNHEAMPFDPDARQLSDRDMERMAEQAREAAKQGRMDEARRRMAELERMLDQLRNAHGRSSQQQGEARRQKGRQQMGAVQDMIGREGGLLDNAERRTDQTMRFTPPGQIPGRPPAFPPGFAPHFPQGFPQSLPPGPPQSGPPDSQQQAGAPDPDAQREADSRVQQALRRALGELMQQFGELTGQVPPSLTDADKAMRESIARLGQGQDKAAGDAQQQAIQALQKGASEMGQAMARQFGRGRPGEDPGDDEGEGEGGLGMMMPNGNRDGGTAGPRPGPMSHANREGRDPLGRYNHGSGADNGDVAVPEERERQRAQAIQEELRRRGAERSRPQEELEYIDRLLKQF